MISVAAVGGLLFVISYGIVWFPARHVLPASVEFGDLKTFRDLSRAISAAVPQSLSGTAADDLSG